MPAPLGLYGIARAVKRGEKNLDDLPAGTKKKVAGLMPLLEDAPAKPSGGSARFGGTPTRIRRARSA